MLAAFFIVAAYLGFAGFGSELMDPPPKPARALSAPAAGGAIAVASRGADSAASLQAADR